MTRREIAIRRAAEIAAVNAYWDAVEAALDARVVISSPPAANTDDVTDLDRAEARRMLARRRPR